MAEAASVSSRIHRSELNSEEPMNCGTENVKLLEGVYQPSIGSSVDELASPALLVDFDGLKSNINRMMELFRGTPVSVRPHMKTGKSSKIAALLLEAGAKGVCVSKVSEAAVLVAGGIEDILITSPIAHTVTAWWLANLLDRTQRIRVVVDSAESADVLSAALAETKISSMEVLIDINVGQNRTGVNPGAPALELANYVAAKGNLKIVGCQGYEGHLQMLGDLEEKKTRCRSAMDELISTATLLRKHGHTIDVVTTGGTGTCLLCGDVEGITEVQPGSFIFMDDSYARAIGSDNFNNALFVLATVISRPASDKVTIDAGWKSLSIDSGQAKPFNNAWTYQSAGDEHGILTGDGVENLQIGERVLIVPSHIDTTVALHEVFYVMQAGKLLGIWPIEARGRVQ